jgi:hypothetical protein
VNVRGIFNIVDVTASIEDKAYTRTRFEDDQTEATPALATAASK